MPLPSLGLRRCRALDWTTRRAYWLLLPRLVLPGLGPLLFLSANASVFVSAHGQLVLVE
jgi:hypothetical protein